MATYNEIEYSLKNLYRGGITSDDEDVSGRQLMFHFRNYRAKLVREDLGKGRTLDRQLIQDLGCVEVECVDAAECCEIADSGATVLRTKEPIPKLLELYNKNLLTFVGTVDKVTPYQVTTPTQARWSKFNKYTGKSTRAYLQSNSNYLYIINAPNGIELINIQGVFENPEEIKNYNNCDGTTCFSKDSEYPISSHMIPVITELIMSKELKVLASTPTDVSNNTKEDAGEQA
jgi:hypothetical protein